MYIKEKDADTCIAIFSTFSQLQLKLPYNSVSMGFFPTLVLLAAEISCVHGCYPQISSYQQQEFAALLSGLKQVNQMNWTQIVLNIPTTTTTTAAPTTTTTSITTSTSTTTTSTTTTTVPATTTTTTTTTAALTSTSTTSTSSIAATSTVASGTSLSAYDLLLIYYYVFAVVKGGPRNYWQMWCNTSYPVDWSKLNSSTCPFEIDPVKLQILKDLRNYSTICQNATAKQIFSSYDYYNPMVAMIDGVCTASGIQVATSAYCGQRQDWGPITLLQANVAAANRNPSDNCVAQLHMIQQNVTDATPTGDLMMIELSNSFICVNSSYLQVNNLWTAACNVPRINGTLMCKVTPEQVCSGFLTLKNSYPIFNSTQFCDARPFALQSIFGVTDSDVVNHLNTSINSACKDFAYPYIKSSLFSVYQNYVCGPKVLCPFTCL